MGMAAQGQGTGSSVRHQRSHDTFSLPFLCGLKHDQNWQFFRVYELQGWLGSVDLVEFTIVAPGQRSEQQEEFEVENHSS